IQCGYRGGMAVHYGHDAGDVVISCRDGMLEERANQRGGELNALHVQTRAVGKQTLVKVEIERANGQRDVRSGNVFGHRWPRLVWNMNWHEGIEDHLLLGLSGFRDAREPGVLSVYLHQDIAFVLVQNK